jgi:hypothetical protein
MIPLYILCSFYKEKKIDVATVDLFFLLGTKPPADFPWGLYLYYSLDPTVRKPKKYKTIFIVKIGGGLLLLVSSYLRVSFPLIVSL